MFLFSHVTKLFNFMRLIQPVQITEMNVFELVEKQYI